MRTLMAASVLVFVVALAPRVDAGNFFEDRRKDLENAGNEVGKVLPKPPEINLPNCGGDVCDALERSKNAIKKLGTKALQEWVNATKEIKVLVETGKCGGEICDLIAAGTEFGVNQLKDSEASFRNAGKRLAEGKPIDALWHLQTDQLNNSQENAAEAAGKSQLLRATGAVAAGAYGGPGGTAAYAAWLTYNETKNMELALKTGLISGIVSYATGSVGKIEFAGDGDIALRAVMTGAISGAGVAAAGGDQKAVEQAFTRGVASALIRDGYRKLTTHRLNEERLQASKGEAYCLAARPDAYKEKLPCMPDDEAYIRDENKEIVYESKDGPPKIDFRKLDPNRPHVGAWSDTNEKPLFGLDERSRVMTGVSRLPGWNAMGVGHDQFDIDTNPETNLAIEWAYRVGTIPAAVVLTYEGSGNAVHDLIREAAVSPKDGREQVGNSGGSPSSSQTATTNLSASMLGAKEITHLVCQREREKKLFLMEVALATNGVVDKWGRICRIDQNAKGAWYSVWHAHYQKQSCVERINAIISSMADRGFECFASLGVRYDMAKVQ